MNPAVDFDFNGHSSMTSCADILSLRLSSKRTPTLC